MTRFRYHSAAKSSWLAIAAEDRLLVVAAPSAEADAARLWSSMARASGIQEALDELTRGGISSAPSFALLSLRGEIDSVAIGLRVIVRGAISIVVRSAGTTSTLDGRGVSTWVESDFENVTGFDVDTDAAESRASSKSFPLPIEIGSAWISAISAGGTDEDTPVAAAPTEFVPAAQIVQQDPVVSAAPAPAESAARVSDTPAGPPTAPIKVTSITASEDTVVEMTQREETLEPTPGQPEADSSGYDFLFGETISRKVEDAAVRVDDEIGEPPVGPPGGDHDGRTVVGLDAAARRAARRARAGVAAASSAPTGPQPYLELSGGAREQLEQPIIVGRAPSASKVPGSTLPRLLTISGPDQDISRNHAQFTVEGGTVVVTDLHSRNGTMVIMPGRPPQQLRAGEPTPVIPDTVVDLGAGITITVREG